jgi:hypothetical protein
MKESLDERTKRFKFEDEKERVENKNKNDEIEILKTKFSAMLAENPIVVYEYEPLRTDESKRLEKLGDINEVNNISGYSTKENSTININFGKYGTYINVNNTRLDGGHLFDPAFRNNKITEDSFKNILTMISESMKTLNFPENDKVQITQRIIDNFKGRILKDEEVANIK